MEDAPKQTYERLRKLLPARLQPAARGIRKRLQRLFSAPLDEPFFSVFPFTQTHIVRQKQLLRLADEIERLEVPGVIVECGVLDGGSAALMAYATPKSGREVHLFDSWVGLPDTSDKDGEAGKKWAGDVVGSPIRVRAIMAKLGVELSRIKFHKGWFEDTFPLVRIEQIALMHIDADFYESVKLSLERWWPHIVTGGYIQLDDYASFQGCRMAVDEFLSEKQEALDCHSENGVDAYFIRKL